jgi:hypothetical protein
VEKSLPIMGAIWALALAFLAILLGRGANQVVVLAMVLASASIHRSGQFGSIMPAIVGLRLGFSSGLGSDSKEL